MPEKKRCDLDISDVTDMASGPVISALASLIFVGVPLLAVVFSFSNEFSSVTPNLLYILGSIYIFNAVAITSGSFFVRSSGLLYWLSVALLNIFDFLILFTAILLFILALPVQVQSGEMAHYSFTGIVVFLFVAALSLVLLLAHGHAIFIVLPKMVKLFISVKRARPYRQRVDLRKRARLVKYYFRTSAKEIGRRLIGLIIYAASLSVVIYGLIHMFAPQLLGYTEEYWDSLSYEKRGQYAGIALIFLFSFPICAIIMARARRLCAISADHVLSDPDRKSLLFLRSFDDEGMDIQNLDTYIKNLFSWGGAETDRVEEIIASELKKIGPFVTFGSPHDKLRLRGASRLYLDDGDWQSAVRVLMQNAYCIIFVPHLTGYLRWELSEIIKYNYLEKTIFLLPGPPNEKARWIRCQMIRDVIKSSAYCEDLDEIMGRRNFDRLFAFNLSGGSSAGRALFATIDNNISLRLSVRCAIVHCFPSVGLQTVA